MTNKELYDLEELIDRHDLSTVVSALSDICFEKAADVLETWQDKALAKAWERAGKRLDTASGHLDV